MADQPIQQKSDDLMDEDEKLSGDDLDRIEATGSCAEQEFYALVQTAQIHRQEAMDLRDALRSAANTLEQMGFTFSASKAYAALAADPNIRHGGESDG